MVKVWPSFADFYQDLGTCRYRASPGDTVLAAGVIVRKALLEEERTIA